MIIFSNFHHPCNPSNDSNDTVADVDNDPSNDSNDAVADVGNDIQMLDISKSESVNGRAHGRSEIEVKSCFLICSANEPKMVFGSHRFF